MLIRLLPFILSLIFSISFTTQVTSQDESEYKPMIIRFDESGKNYLRFIFWNQFWLSSQNLESDLSFIQPSLSIRRSRILAFAQMNDRFLLLSHFGLNGLNAENLSSLGNNSDAPQIFLHGAWGEYKLNEQLFIGAGLHYWRGLTRLSNQSTISFMTMDQSRPFSAWHSLGITDQFARNLGIYLKGRFKGLEYRFAWNSAGQNPLGEGKDYSSMFNPEAEPKSILSYTGAMHNTVAGRPAGKQLFEGYFKYDLWDREANKLPYYAGTYLGKKQVLSVGTGFFYHPSGMFEKLTGTHRDVLHLAADLFLDMPTSSGAMNFYTSVKRFDYGKNYVSRWAGTGMVYYGQFGYFIRDLKLMPYVGYAHANYQAAQQAVRSLNTGINYFIQGHNCKLTAEYHRIDGDYREKGIEIGGTEAISQVRIQFQVFL